MRQSAWWLCFQMLYFFKTFGFPSGEFLYFLSFSAHSASCQYFFFSRERAPTEWEARSTYLDLYRFSSTAALPRKPQPKYTPRPKNTFFFFLRQITNLKQGIFWGRGASTGHLSGLGVQLYSVLYRVRRAVGRCLINCPVLPARGC